MIWSPSTTAPGVVDGEAAVGVTVVGDAEVGAVLEHAPRAAGRGASSRTPSLMLRPSGSAPITIDLGAGVGERLGRDARRRRRGRSRPRRAGRRAGPAAVAEQVREVAVLGVGEAADAAHVRARSAGSLARASRASMRVLERVGELGAAAGEELDAVVGHRIVRGRDHHAEVGAEVGHEERRRPGSGSTPDIETSTPELASPADTAAERNSPLRGCRARPRRWAPPAARRPANAPVAEHGAAADRAGEGQLGGEFAVREPPNAVRAEEPRHHASARRSALRVLRRLAGLLETGLLALDDARVTGEEAGLLQGGAVVLAVDLVERAGDGEAQRAGLARGAAAGDAGDDVVAAVGGRAPSGSLMSCWCTLFGKYSSSVRPLTVNLPVPGTIRTRAIASLRRPTAAPGAVTISRAGAALAEVSEVYDDGPSPSGRSASTPASRSTSGRSVTVASVVTATSPVGVPCWSAWLTGRPG